MNPKIPCLFLAAVLLLALGGCVAKSDYLQKSAEAEGLQRDLLEVKASYATAQELAAQAADARAEEQKRREAETAALNTQLKAQQTAASAAVRRLEQRILELEGDKQMLRESIDLLKKRREEEVKTVSKTYESLLTQMKGEIEQGQVQISELKGKLTVDVVDKILFDSGRAEIKPEGLEVLRRVVEILLTVTDKLIRVEGHTDNVPIAGALAKRYPTNWELSAARALTVTRYLEQAGLDPALLSAAAFGEHQPVAGNDTPEGRAKNRRIAITLLPKE